MINTKVKQLKKETEMRCEIPENSTLILKLIAGTAEIFGIEMASNKEYTFRDQNIALYTWYGCTIETTGDDSGLYETDSTPMIAYVNTHVQLEAKRDVALANKELGPRVMIVGPTDHGKSTLSQILAAYAVRLDRTPILVDLDVGQGAFGIPGCLSAVPLDKSCLNVEDGFTNITPLVYFHGHTTPKENTDLYKTLVDTISIKVNERLLRDIDSQSSGIIINTCGWIDGEGYELLLHCIKAFNVDVVLVMNHDKLYSNLISSLGSVDNMNYSNVTVVKLPRSGGVVQRDTNTRKRIRKSKIKEYFYGKIITSSLLSGGLTTLFSPERRESIPLSSFTFLRIGGIQLSEGMKVFGDKTIQDTIKLIKITPTQDLVYNIVGILHNIDIDEQNNNQNQLHGNLVSNRTNNNTTIEISQSLIKSNIAGFISIVQIDLDRGVMTILCPCPGALPSCNLLVGAIKWLE